MRPKSLLLLGLALGCGLVASIGINQVMANRRTSGPATIETTPIFVAAEDIGLGDLIATEQLKLEDWPKDKVPPGAIAKLEEMTDRRARAKIYAGEPMLEAKLFDKGKSAASASDQIPKGMRTATVKVDNVTGGADLLKVGDRVDMLVFLEKNESKGIFETKTVTFLQNIKVFAVNSIFSRTGDEEGAISAKTVTLLATPEQCEIVMQATQLGTVQLVMRGVGDQDTPSTVGTTASELFAGGSGADSGAKKRNSLTDVGAGLLGMLNSQSKAPPRMTPEPAPVTPTFALPPADEWTMKVLVGSELKRFQFRNGELVDDEGLGGNSLSSLAIDPFAGPTPEQQAAEPDTLAAPAEDPLVPERTQK